MKFDTYLAEMTIPQQQANTSDLKVSSIDNLNDVVYEIIEKMKNKNITKLVIDGDDVVVVLKNKQMDYTVWYKQSIKNKHYKSDRFTRIQDITACFRQVIVKLINPHTKTINDVLSVYDIKVKY